MVIGSNNSGCALTVAASIVKELKPSNKISNVAAKAVFRLSETIAFKNFYSPFL